MSATSPELKTRDSEERSCEAGKLTRVIGIGCQTDGTKSLPADDTWMP